MSRHFTPPRPDRPAPGAAAVGHLSDLDPVSQLAVLSLRLWCDRGPEALARDFAQAGDAGGAAAAFSRFCGYCLTTARRPLMRHGAGCPCLGADEAALAEVVRLAADCEREDALMLAFVMLRPDAAPEGVALAQQAGLMLRRMILRADTAGATMH